MGLYFSTISGLLEFESQARLTGYTFTRTRVLKCLKVVSFTTFRERIVNVFDTLARNALPIPDGNWRASSLANFEEFEVSLCSLLSWHRNRRHWNPAQRLKGLGSLLALVGMLKGLAVIRTLKEILEHQFQGFTLSQMLLSELNSLL